jgi:hypothetical protein
MVKIHKFVTSNIIVHTLASLRSFYVYVYIGLYLCVSIGFDTIGETAIIPVENNCPYSC